MVDNGRLRCLFTRRKNNTAYTDDIYDLENDYYFLVAKGRVDDRGERHTGGQFRQKMFIISGKSGTCHFMTSVFLQHPRSVKNACFCFHQGTKRDTCWTRTKIRLCRRVKSTSGTSSTCTGEPGTTSSKRTVRFFSIVQFRRTLCHKDANSAGNCLLLTKPQAFEFLHSLKTRPDFYTHARLDQNVS